MLVNNREVIFIHIPKTAGNSIRESVFGKGLKTSHKLADDYDQKQWEMSFSFCVVRNPYTRVYSSYKYHVKSDYEGVLLKRHPKLREYSLKDYLKKIVLQGDSLLETQYRFTTHSHTKKKIDLAIQFEKLSDGIKDLEKALDLDINIEHLNKGPLQRSYLSEFDWDDMKIVNSVYQKDFEEFGYKKFGFFTFCISKLKYKLKCKLKRYIGK